MWLKERQVHSVATEATGIYWIPIHDALQAAGLEVTLFHGAHARNLPGRKSDVSDCQWIQYLHAVGLLKASFRPPDQICVSVPYGAIGRASFKWPPNTQCICRRP